MTYRRTDIGSDDRRIGYIANHWDSCLGSGMRNIIGSAIAEDGTELKALDYSRLTPIMHGALLSVMAQLDAALARIEALESRA
jgi:hypothetical protein